MSEALDRLSEIVRQAEAKSRAQRIHIEIRDASEGLRSAAERARAADQRLREIRPTRQQELAQTEIEEQKLKEVVKKMAQVKTSLDDDDTPEELILAAQREIELKKRQAMEELEDAIRESEESKRELRLAMDEYEQLHCDLDRLHPQLLPGLAAEDRLMCEAAMYFPTGQLKALAKEIEDGIGLYGQLAPQEQYAQLKIWIGRYRRLQTFPLDDDEQALSRRIFGKLVGLSKEYEPGYIEAFQINFSCDWDKFVEEAQDQLRHASEQTRRKRDMDRQHADYQSHEQERTRAARESAQGTLDELKALLIRYNLPDEGAEEFREVLSRAVAGLGSDDEEVLDLVMPFRDLIDTWSEFRSLRRNLDRIREEETGSSEAMQDQFDDLVTITRGMKVMLIGGVAREDVRRSLERVFDFDCLDWETHEDTDPAVLDSIEQRVRSRDVDLVLMLKEFIRHHLPEKMRPLCEQYGVPCLMIEHGHGPAQVAETLRRGLLRAL